MEQDIVVFYATAERAEDAGWLPRGKAAEITGAAVVNGEAAVAVDGKIGAPIRERPRIREGNGLPHRGENPIGDLAVQDRDHERSRCRSIRRTGGRSAGWSGPVRRR